jgi:exo-beta-1,3-glucanase (GH17 family)
MAALCYRKPVDVGYVASVPQSAPYGYPTAAPGSASSISIEPISEPALVPEKVVVIPSASSVAPPQTALVSAPASNAALVVSIPTPASNPTVPATSAPAAAESGSSSNPNVISGKGVAGIAWDPYKGAAPGTCKTKSEVAADIAQLISYGYSTIRLYGVECNAISNALSAVSGTNTKLIVAIYTVDAVNSETASLVSQVAGRWDLVEYVSVFNEAVNDGRATVTQVKNAITYVRSQIPSSVKVTTIDTFTAFISNPTLCNVGQDFIAANVQPYFGAGAASDAGDYVVQQQANVAAACGVSSVSLTGTTFLSKVNYRIRLAGIRTSDRRRHPQRIQ